MKLKIIGWPYKTLNKNQTRQIQILKNKKKIILTSNNYISWNKKN